KGSRTRSSDFSFGALCPSRTTPRASTELLSVLDCCAGPSERILLRPLVLAHAASPRTAAGFARRLGCGASYGGSAPTSRSTSQQVQLAHPHVRRACARAKRRWDRFSSFADTGGALN